MIAFPEVLQTIIELIRVKDQLEAENKQLKEFIQKMNQRLQEEKIPCETCPELLRRGNELAVENEKLKKLNTRRLNERLDEVRAKEAEAETFEDAVRNYESSSERH